MEDALIDELNFSIRVKYFKKLAKFLSRHFNNLLWVSCLLVEDDVPEGVGAVSGSLRRWNAYIADSVE